VGVDITVQKNKLQKYKKKTSYKAPGHRKKWTWLQTRITNKQKNGTKTKIHWNIKHRLNT